MAKAKTPRTNGTSVKSTSEKPVSQAGRVSVPPVPINLQEEIRRRAYELYEQRGCSPGRENEDWFLAEQEVRSRYQRQQSA